MATIKSEIATTDSGKFQLCVDYQFSATQIKLIPYVVVSQKFSKKHDIVITWKNSTGQEIKHTERDVKETGTYYPAGKDWRTNGDYSVTVKCTVNGKSESVTITSTLVPSKPSLKVTRVNDYHYKLTITGSGTKAVPVNSVVIERQSGTTNDSWTVVDTRNLGGDTDSYSLTETDQATEPNERYRWRVKAVNQAGSSGYTVSDWNYTKPDEASNVIHERLSNTQCRITWSRNQQDIDRKIVTDYRLEGSVNEGAWEVRKKSCGTGTRDESTMSVISSTSANKSYSFRVVPINAAGVGMNPSPAEGTTRTYNTPAAPVSLTAAYNSNGTTKVKWTNTDYTTATDLLIERKAGTGAWTQIADITLSASSGTYTDSTAPSGVELIYRARNQANRTGLPAEEQFSKYTKSQAVITLTTPNPPTLHYPVNNGIAVIDDSTVRLSWSHNSLDGSAQTAAELTYTANGTAHTVQLTTQAYYELDISTMPANTVIEWSVKTKGQAPDFSNSSEERTFTVLSNPELTITSPENGGIITNLPLTFGYSYSDESGSLQGITLEVIEEDKVIYKAEVPASSTTFDLDGVLFANDTEYSLNAVALSSSGLTAVDSIGFMVSYEPLELVHGVLADVSFDAETGWNSITISANETEPSEEAIDVDIVESYLYRATSEGRVLIAGGLQEDDSVIDKNAPINTDYVYELLSITEDGRVALEITLVRNDSKYWYIYADDISVKLLYEPNGSIDLSRPEKTAVRYSGREFPVTYDSSAMEETYSLSASVVEREQLEKLRSIVRKGGTGIWKSCDGDVYLADIKVSYSADFAVRTPVYKCNISVTRIESEVL